MLEDIVFFLMFVLTVIWFGMYCLRTIAPPFDDEDQDDASEADSKRAG